MFLGRPGVRDLFHILCTRPIPPSPFLKLTPRVHPMIKDAQVTTSGLKISSQREVEAPRPGPSRSLGSSERLLPQQLLTRKNAE